MTMISNKDILLTRLVFGCYFPLCSNRIFTVLTRLYCIAVMCTGVLSCIFIKKHMHGVSGQHIVWSTFEFTLYILMSLYNKESYLSDFCGRVKTIYNIMGFQFKRVESNIASKLYFMLIFKIIIGLSNILYHFLIYWNSSYLFVHQVLIFYSIALNNLVTSIVLDLIRVQIKMIQNKLLSTAVCTDDEKIRNIKKAGLVYKNIKDNLNSIATQLQIRVHFFFVC